ncbi:MAG: SIS domain-containing protein, partial [Acidimicrobiales bacterium]
MVVTNVPDSPLGRLADAVLPLDVEQDSVAYTVGYTATLQALGLLGDALLADAGSIPNWDRLPRLVEEVLALATDAVLDFLDHCGTPRAVDAVGTGGSAAAAGEAALLLRETCRVPTGCFSTRQYLHGPLEAAESGVADIFVGDGR